MKEAKASKAAIGAFQHNYEQLVAGVTGLVRLLMWVCLIYDMGCTFSEKERYDLNRQLIPLSLRCHRSSPRATLSP